MMNKRLRKVATLIVLVGVFLIVTGVVFPRELAIFTGAKVVSERVLIPGGQSVGIEMNVSGVLIVGIENDQIEGPQPGDMIISVNNQKVNSPSDVNVIVGKTGKPVDLIVSRNNRKKEYTITPYFDKDSGTYKLGLWIKEKIAGIGTLSFYDPKTNKFASLGHGIYETETGTLLEAKKGALLNTKVNKITAGKDGVPGEIAGVIYNFQNPLGSIDKNTEYGVYGTAKDEEAFKTHKEMVMATKEEIEEGDAEIFTTINGTKVEKFTISIMKIHYQGVADSKGLEFQVTDKKLLKSCGGIVQGMSGSPIIQNNRIIGAVTHVFVNNPKKGYGIFAEWMVEEVDK